MKANGSLLVVILSICCSLATLASDKKPSTNWGLKLGFNSAVPTLHISSENEEWTAESTNKVGFNSEAFFRLNLHKFFIQPELAHTFQREQVSLYNENKNRSIPLKINTQSVDFSSIIGFYAVQEKAYGLSLFGGCKARYAYRIKVNKDPLSQFKDDDQLYNLYLTTGIGVNIANLFFDVRYDIAFKKNHIDPQGIIIGEQNINSLYRKSNIISFSLGLFL